MATSLGQLLDTLIDTARTTTDSPAARADAATALGRLGRALARLRADGVSTSVEDQRERRVAALADACIQVGRRAPTTEARLAELAAAAADTIGILREEFTVASRWAAATELTDTITVLTEVTARGLSAGPAARWLTAVDHHAILVEQLGALDPTPRADAALLDRPLPGLITPAADGVTVVTEAVAVLVQTTARPTQPPSIAELLAYTAAAETLSAAAHALDHTTTMDRPTGAEAAAGPLTAVDAWRSVRAALAPFNDGSRRLHPHAPPTVLAAGRLHAALRHLGPDPTAWSPPVRAAVAAAAQHLPTLAAHLDRAVRSWAATGVLVAYAVDLPARDDRVTEYLRGHRPGGVIRADIVDLRSLSDALANAQLQSAAVATRAADPPVRRTAAFPRRAFAASRALLGQPQAAAALKKATEQANRHQQAARSRPTGRGRPR